MKKLMLLSRLIIGSVFVCALFIIVASLLTANAEVSGYFTAPGYYGWQNYSMGYRFKPNISGNVTQFSCYNVQSQSGQASNTVSLWSDSGGPPLAQVTVPCTVGWASANLPSPVAVTAGTYYYLSVSPGNYYQTIPSVNYPLGNITIDQGYYNTSGMNLFPNTTPTGTGIYGIPDLTIVAGGSLDNGAGGSYTCASCTNQQHALAACQSKYGAGACTIGSCGNFSFYYPSSDLSCNCSTSLNSYEWIYSNTGYTQVGQDYGGQATDVTGDSLFVRKKGSSGCDASSWMLSLKDLGAATSGGGVTSTTFNYTGGQQTWVVPSGVSSVTLEAWGGQGGQGYGSAGSYTGQTGGLGGYAKGNLSVSAGQTLYIYAGGAGQNGAPNIQTSGGFGGGGGGSPSNGNIASYSGGGGGGASDVRYGGNALGNRVIVAGGGGGGGSYMNAWAGAGGYPSGTNANDSSGAGTGGTGGIQTAGGTGSGTAGSLGAGGNGGSGYCGGGGGGGYYGGGSSGGSCNSTGAGGGSSYIGGVTGTTTSNGVQSGNGKVIVTYTIASTNTLTVSKAGAGVGTVTANIGGINCGATCSYAYSSGTALILTASPNAGSTFSGWSGAGCSGTGTCSITMSSAQSVTATFTVAGPTSVTTTGGTGVSENQATFNGTANPNNLLTTGWYRYSTTNPVTCNDTFGTRLPASGGGTVGSGSSSLPIQSQTTPATLSYNTTYYVCAIASNSNGTTPASNVMQVITAPPPPTFVTPAPSATTVSAGNYTITWTSTAANGASYYPFRINDVTLNPGGLGTNYPGGAAALCAANAANTTNDVCYNTPNATTTTYSYTFTAGHTYAIWIHSFNSTTGAWSSARSITVTATYPLVVVKNAGSGSSGTVTSLDGNINCGVTCSFNYTTNASLKLTATPDSITQFLSWTGVPCTGPGESSQTATTCTFNAGSITGPPANTVTASFTKITYLLTVSKNGGSAGLGTGTVQSTTSGSPDGLINCGSTCTHTYDMNTLVTLKETPDSTATFAGWSGTSCTEGNNTSATCTFPMNAAKTVTANFNSVGYTGDVTFYFGSSNQTSCNPGAGKNTKPALEVVIVSGSVATPGITKYVFDPCSRVAGTLGASPAGAPYQGVSFTNKATVAAISHGLIMKVIPLYNSTIVGVQGTDVFPTQGKVIQSTGSAGDSARKVIYYESYPQIPNEVFPYSILSQ